MKNNKTKDLLSKMCVFATCATLAGVFAAGLCYGMEKDGLRSECVDNGYLREWLKYASAQDVKKWQPILEKREAAHEQHKKDALVICGYRIPCPYCEQKAQEAREHSGR